MRTPACGSCDEDLAGRHFRDPTRRASSTLRVSPASDSERRRLVQRLAGQRRDDDFAGAERDPHRRGGEHDVGQQQRADEQEQLARAPYARRKCHELMKFTAESSVFTKGAAKNASSPSRCGSVRRIPSAIVEQSPRSLGERTAGGHRARNPAARSRKRVDHHARSLPARSSRSSRSSRAARANDVGGLLEQPQLRSRQRREVCLRAPPLDVRDRAGSCPSPEQGASRSTQSNAGWKGSGRGSVGLDDPDAARARSRRPSAPADRPAGRARRWRR